MSQRAMVDRQSFEQFLAATCFLQQLRQEASRRAADCPQAMDDVYIPGIGVRAALGGDVSEPSTFWPELRENARQLTQGGRHHLSGMSERVKDAASRSLNGLRNLSGNTRHEVVAPHAEQVSGQSGLVEHRPRHDSHSTVRRYVLQAQSLLLGAWQSVRIQLRRNAQCQPKPLPVRRWTDDLYRWRPSSSLPNWKTVGKQLVSSFGSMLDLNWLRRDAPVWAVLFVILLFLFLQMGMHDSSKHVPVPSVNAAQASAVASKPTVASDVTSSKPQAGLHKLRQGGKATAHTAAHRRRKPTRPANWSAK